MVSAIVIGAINWDVNLFIERFPRKGEEVVIKHITRVPGGKGGNVAVAASRLLGPVKVGILGGLGIDSIASEQLRIFHEEGVVTDGIRQTRRKESGQAYILIDESGENVIHTHFGANVSITPKSLDHPRRRALISKAAIVGIMDPPFETSLKLAKLSKRSGKIVAWDPGVKSTLGLVKTRELIENVDYVVANESEMANLTAIGKSSEAARRLAKINPGITTIAKRGVRGAVMFRGREQIVAKPFDLKANGMRAVNTVGCGDAFLGAFLAALVENRSIEEALKWANCAGALKSTSMETRGSPKRETLLRYVG